MYAHLDEKWMRLISFENKSSMYVSENTLVAKFQYDQIFVVSCIDQAFIESWSRFTERFLEIHWILRIWHVKRSLRNKLNVECSIVNFIFIFVATNAFAFVYLQTWWQSSIFKHQKFWDVNNRLDELWNKQENISLYLLSRVYDTRTQSVFLSYKFIFILSSIYIVLRQSKDFRRHCEIASIEEHSRLFLKRRRDVRFIRQSISLSEFKTSSTRTFVV